MSRLFIVRHGQASLFTDDYDRLSELGFEQAGQLGRHWIGEGIVPDAVYSGSLLRQRQTADGVAEALRESGQGFPELQIFEGLNEYPAEDIMRVLVPLLRESSDELRQMADEFETATEHKDRYRALHRLLTTVISHWIEGSYDSGEPLLSWSDFSGGVRSALRQIVENTESGKTIAVFTSGGPVGLSVQTVLGAPDQAAADLNWRVHNGSVTRFTFSGSRVALDAFNDTAHLGTEMLTYR
jgi:broad specificity phosphatase PhoE